MLKFPTLTVSVIFTLLLLFVSFVLGLIFDMVGLGEQDKPNMFFESVISAIYYFIIWILISPVFETAIFQLIPYALFKRYSNFDRNRWITIIISGFFFSVVHLYSIYYFILTFLGGIILMYLFLMRVKINEKNAFVTVALTHMLRNFVSFILICLRLC